MISTTLSFFFGILCLHLFKKMPTLSEILLWFGIYFVISAMILHIFSKQKKFFLLPLLAFPIGFLWILLNARGVVEHWLPNDSETKPIEVVGIIETIPEMQDNILRFELAIKKVIPDSLWPTPGKVKLKWVDPTHEVRVGEEWLFHVRLKRPRSYFNPGCSDHERQQFLNRIVAEGTVVDKSPYHKVNDQLFSHPVDKIRSSLQKKAMKALGNSRFSAVIVALVLGMKNDITQEQWQVFKNSGTAHLMAISGLHIGMVSGFVFAFVCFCRFFLPLVCFKTPIKQFAAISALISAWLYAILAGFSVPTQRSVIMISLFMFSIIVRRKVAILRNYFAALLLVLILDPLSTLSPGFWLSFVAVGIILYGMTGRLRPKGFWWRFGRIQWVVFWGLAPLSFTLFQMNTLISPLVNAIAIPWVSFLVVPFSLCGTIGLFFHEKIGSFFLSGADFFMSLFWPFLQWTANFSQGIWHYGNSNTFSLMCMLVGVLLLLAPRGFPLRIYGFFWLLPLVLLKPMGIGKGEVYVTILDVGQGLAVVVETENHAYVFDTGPKLSPQFDTGERVVIPYLRTRGRTKVDSLILSHGDNDHMGGCFFNFKHFACE